MSRPTPGDVSRRGQLLWIEHPIGGLRPMSHVFDLAGGGIAFVDHGWSEGGGRPHVEEGAVTANRDGSWILRSAREGLGEDCARILIRLPGPRDPDGIPDGERAIARRVLDEDLAPAMVPDPVGG